MQPATGLHCWHLDASKEMAIAAPPGATHEARLPDRCETARFDSRKTLAARPADNWVAQEAVIGIRVADTLTTGSRQLVEQRLGLF